MKQLIMVRHGKSSWDYDVDDRDRPLQLRGIKDGIRVSEALNALKINIEAVYSSPANRALHTCTIFLRKLHVPLEQFRLANELYEFSGSGVMDFVRNLPDSQNTVMIFGHNNAFTNVVNQWGSTDVDNVPTTGLAHLRFDTDHWKQLKKGETLRFLFPKDLK